MGCVSEYQDNPKLPAGVREQAPEDGVFDVCQLPPEVFNAVTARAEVAARAWKAFEEITERHPGIRVSFDEPTKDLLILIGIGWSHHEWFDNAQLHRIIDAIVARNS